ncbi:MAG: bifunctional metallophosphatase/5'-nucleotidase [Tannerellaceae bacterium]|jgi:2',3'-cyclic-nucleotide 2'-phosphodiesterase/3'-nucleotidase|nr:bifunctional metallophosphatase/5'-nucleotidase [Tannerellaceae bacterium]
MGNVTKYTCRVTGVLLLMLCFCGVSLHAQTSVVELKLVETSDIHGNYLPYNYVDLCERNGGLSRIYSYLKQERRKYGDNLLLFDNGDMIEGHPACYYYNYIDTVSPHIAANMMNYMRYDAGGIGNHEIETGIPVLNRWMEECNFPVLSANVVWESDGKPYAKPYAVFERAGIRIAVLGLTTTATQAWVCKSMWRGLKFLDMEETARKWLPVIREKENPDIVIGLFHSGKDSRVIGGAYKDNVSLEIARDVPGFDIVMMGHDHNLYCGKIANANGDSVLIVNPGDTGIALADITLSLEIRNGAVVRKNINGSLVDTGSREPDEDFMKRYAVQHEVVKEFVLQKIGIFTEKVTTRPAYFGPSAFVDFIHSLQLSITDADVSFASPLSFDTSIERGDVRICDMFRLYRYKNLIYTMNLSGKEIKNYLEESYSRWTNRMESPDDNLLLFLDNEYRQTLFANYYYFFDSAAGIIYTVDVSKPTGEKIHIVCLSDGKPFEPNQMYSVAMNSYRGNGGGELLTKGAGLPAEELESRVLSITDKDFRYYLVDYIKQNKMIHPRVLNHWKFIPDEWVRSATERDYRRLFGEK